MNTIVRGYGLGKTAIERQLDRAKAADVVRTRGTARIPLPPRGLIAQPAPRGILLTWNLPAGFSLDIQRWRVYRENESTLYVEINDRGTRQHFIESSAGATPPVNNFFVSSVNSLGVESPKVMVQGAALAESGAPTMPSVPPDYNTGGSGGGNTDTNYKGGGTGGGGGRQL